MPIAVNTWKNFVLYTRSKEISHPKIIKKESLRNRSWEHLYSYRGIIHIPYNISTMSIFEQKAAGIPLFFPNKSKIIKSYILLKMVYGEDRFIVAMGSKDANKFTKDQQVDLVEYLIQIIQIKLVDLN